MKPKQTLPLSKRIKHAAEYFFLRASLATLSLLPFSVRIVFARAVLGLAGWMKLNTLAMRNLDLAYGDSISQTEKKEILRKLKSNLSRVAAEMVSIYKNKAKFFAANVIEDASLQKVMDSLKQGKGVIVVTPHFGNWELMPSWATQHDFRGAVVGKKLKNAKINEFLVQLRSQSTVSVIFQHESPRKILRVLADNGLIGILPDADTLRLDGIFLPFFGRETYTLTAPASLSIISGAPIIPIYLVYEEGKYRLRADDPIFPQTKERSEEELRRLSLAWSDSFERTIRRYPDQWVWFQRRWVNAPATTPSENPERV